MQNEQNTITNVPVLTLDSDAMLETAQSKADLIWHEIQNAYRTKKILTGMLGGIEKTENGSLIAIVYYKDFRTVIPITEMMINLVQDESHDYGDISLRQNKVLNNMLGCEIDFIVKGQYLSGSPSDSMPLHIPAMTAGWWERRMKFPLS